MTHRTPLSRKIIAQAIEATEQLAGDGYEAERVHAARALMKRVRAEALAYRRLRPGLAEALRGLAKAVADELAPARDRDVIGDTARSLGLRRMPEGAAQGELALAEDGVRWRLTLIARLAASLPDLRRRDIARAVRRALHRASAGFATANRRATVEALHRWRRRLNDLVFLLEADRRIEKVTRPLRRQSKSVARLLGRDHDLAVLTATLRAAPRSARARAALQAATAERRRLRAEAIEAGRRIEDELGD